MTREETIKLLSIIKAAYPMSFYKMTRTDANAMINLWAQAFANESYELVNAAVGDYIKKDRSGFPPAIGQIGGIIADYGGVMPTPQEDLKLIEAAFRSSYGG